MLGELSRPPLAVLIRHAIAVSGRDSVAKAATVSEERIGKVRCDRLPLPQVPTILVAGLDSVWEVVKG